MKNTARGRSLVAMGLDWRPGTDCLRAFRETQPVAALASMILQGLVEVELDGELIGPETMVRRIGT